MEFDRSFRRMRQLNMIPLINVVFLLLIFFLVAGRVEKPDVIPMDIPEAESGKLVEGGSVTILLGVHEDIIIDDALVEMSAVEDTVAKKLDAYPNAIITLKADARLEARRMIDVLQAIKRAGGVNVSLVTQSQGA